MSLTEKLEILVRTKYSIVFRKRLGLNRLTGYSPHIITFVAMKTILLFLTRKQKNKQNIYIKGHQQERNPRMTGGRKWTPVSFSHDRCERKKISSCTPKPVMNSMHRA